MLRVVGGTLLVAGTTIGAGMLALPVTTGLAGFWPALILFAVVWAFMTYTAFLTLEANYVMEGKINLITMARRTLGPVGSGIAWVVYLLLLYSLIAAYVSGSSALLIESIRETTGYTLAPWVGPLPFVIGFGLLIYLGMKPVDYINRLLMIGLVVCYVALLIFIYDDVQFSMLTYTNWPYLFVPLTVVVTSFGYHIIIPSLNAYLNRDLKKMRLCLLLGAILPLVVYILWQIAVCGVVPPTGDPSLKTMLASGQPAASLTRSLRTLAGSDTIPLFAAFFGFFAMLTSFLGVSLSLCDFLKDGFKIKGSIRGRIAVVLLTMIPPLLIAIAYPRGFVLALSYAGVFVAILLGLYPIAMVWSERYIKKRGHEYRVIGGPVPLVIAAVFFIGVITLFFFQGA